jgi:hypothetical protein
VNLFGSTSLTATNPLLANVLLNNYGTLAFNAAGVTVLQFQSATLNNYGTIVHFTSATNVNSLMSSSSGTISFTNYGLMNLTMPASTSFSVNVPFDSAVGSTLIVNDGRFNFGASGTQSGVVLGKFGTAQLRLTGGTVLFSTTSSITASTMEFAGSTTTVRGRYDILSLVQTSGTTTFDNVTVSLCSMSMTGGTLVFTATVPLYMTSFTPSGGITRIFGQAVIRDLSLAVVGVTFQVTSTGRAWVDNLVFSGASLQIDGSMSVNTSMLWSGNNGVITRYTGAAAGSLDLLSSSQSTFSATGTTQQLQYVTINNYGYLTYAAQGTIGVQASLGGAFVNHNTAIFEVPSTIGFSAMLNVPVTNYGMFRVYG